MSIKKINENSSFITTGCKKRREEVIVVKRNSNFKPSIYEDTITKCAFQKKIYEYYHEYGRNLPWRKTKDPYKIVVSEIMLQQTQVSRVLDKYPGFIKSFPDIQSLARANLRSIMKQWQGLGYNRRAKALKKAAEEVVERFDGKIPSDETLLRSLPGIGPYTASAICVFAFNKPSVFIETNIRSVFIHHFFNDRTSVKDSEIIPLITQTLDTEQPRKWYYALMDYGTMLKTVTKNPSRKSAHYTQQSPFIGSDRQIRGMVLKLLIDHEKISEAELNTKIAADITRTRKILKQLVKEGIIIKHGNYLSIE